MANEKEMMDFSKILPLLRNTKGAVSEEEMRAYQDKSPGDEYIKRIHMEGINKKPFNPDSPFESIDKERLYKQFNKEEGSSNKSKTDSFKIASGDQPDDNWKKWYLMSIGYPASYPISGFKGSYEDYVKEMEDQRNSKEKWYK